MNLGDIARNDVRAALRYVEDRLDRHGDLRRDEAQVLVMLQDDPTEYFERYDALMKHRRALGLTVPKR